MKTIQLIIDLFEIMIIFMYTRVGIMYYFKYWVCRYYVNV